MSPGGSIRLPAGVHLAAFDGIARSRVGGRSPRWSPNILPGDQAGSVRSGRICQHTKWSDTAAHKNGQAIRLPLSEVQSDQ